MLAFFSIGTLLENYYGRNRYIALLFISLTFGSLASYLFNPPQASAVGASGMIFGLFGAYAILRKKFGGNLREALTLVAVNMAIPLLIPGIDWKAHLGGLIGGALTALVLKPARGNISQL
jgi:membrane associated rhomboid family serine protease